MTFKYKYQEEHVKHCLEQVWESDEKYGGTLQVYDDLAPYEYEQIKEFIPPELYGQGDFSRGNRVLELGAGQGRGSIYLNHVFNNSNLSWVLADRDGSSKKNTGAFNPKEDEYYCDFESTKSFCKINGLSRFTMFDTEKEDWRQLGKFKFIFSFCSFGMHVPIERYIDQIANVSYEGTTLIFGTRHAGYNDKSFSDKFKEIIFKPSKGQAPFPIENWLILKGLK